MNLADASVFISCAMSLAVFDITKPVENGQVIEPVHGVTSGTIRFEWAPYCVLMNIANLCLKPPLAVQVHNQA